MNLDDMVARAFTYGRWGLPALVVAALLLSAELLTEYVGAL